MRERILAAAALALLSFGCDDDNGDDARVLGVATYNAGLAPGFVPFTEQRAPLTIQAIADQSVDMMCVQEVWLEQDVQALRDATDDKWPSAIFPPPDPGEVIGDEPACGPGELDPLQACLTASCAGLQTDQLASCAVASCGAELGALPETCSTCLVANLGASFEAIRLSCTTGSAGAFAFGGSFGIGLLAEAPILSEDLLVLESTFNRRGVIYALLDTEELGPVHTFCTHLTAIFDDIPFPGEGGWEGEQARQIEALLDFVQDKTGGTGQVLLMGDLNTGPAIDGVVAATPENFQRLTDAGFASPYLRAGAECTFCAANPLVSDDDDSVIIDHVLVRGIEAGDLADRILTGDLDIALDGEQVNAAFSDHYGVAASFSD